MPTYQYACTNPDCATRFELVQTFTDAAASECPVCGSPVRKVYGSVGVVFKGPGFYRTDSRAAASASTASNGSTASKADSKSDAKSDSRSDSRSDSKSDARSDSKSTSAKADTSKSAPVTSGSGTSTKAAASA